MSKYQSRKRLPRVLTVATFALILCSIFLAYSLTSHSAAVSVLNKSVPRQANISTPTAGTKQTLIPTPATKPTPLNSQQRGQTSTQADGGVVATPTQSSQTGVFALSAGGPLPISEGILHPTNIARMLLNGLLTSVYAGSLTQNPQVGVLCVLQEDLASGQIEMHMYQSSPAKGPLTILAVQNTTLSIADPQAQGTFNLSTGQFQW